MASESENQGGCGRHGPFHVCGHSSTDCPDLKTETEGQGVLESPTLKQYEQALAFAKKDKERSRSEPVKAATIDELRQWQLDAVVAAETMNKVFLASYPLVDLEDNRGMFKEIIMRSPEGVNQTDLIEKFKESAGQRVAEVIGEKKSPERILSELKYDLQDLARKIERLSEKLKSLDRESTEAYGIENVELPRLKETLLKTEARLKEEEETKRSGIIFNMTNRDSGNNGIAVPDDGAIRVASDEKTVIEDVEKTENKTPVAASSVGEQENNEKSLEKKVEELKETARKRAEGVGKVRRQIAECTGRILASDKKMPSDIKEFFLDSLWPQLEVMSSRNGLFLVRDGGFYFNETVQVATKWLKTIEKAAALAESTDTEGWNKFMVGGMPNAIKGSFMMDEQFWGFPSNGVVDTFGVPTFEKIAKMELEKNK